jgi:hypothetical protein
MLSQQEKHVGRCCAGVPISARNSLSTGVLRDAGAEMTVRSRRTLKLIWVIPAERGHDVFRRTGLPLSHD